MKCSHIQSFVRRNGRLSDTQKAALKNLWKKYGLTFSEEKINLNKLFNNSAEVVLDIGFGDGRSLLTMALRHPHINYLGVEVYRFGIASLMIALERESVSNVRICEADAIHLLQQGIEDNALAGIHIFFPDPWPKTRHHKRRLVQNDFVALAIKKLKKGGHFCLATDWEDYARQMMVVLNNFEALKNKAGFNQFLTNKDHRAPTKFEKRGEQLGHSIWDLFFVKEK